MTNMKLLLGYQIFLAFQNEASNIIEYSEWGRKTFPFVLSILPPLYSVVKMTAPLDSCSLPDELSPLLM